MAKLIVIKNGRTIFNREWPYLTSGYDQYVVIKMKPYGVRRLASHRGKILRGR